MPAVTMSTSPSAIHCRDVQADPLGAGERRRDADGEEYALAAGRAHLVHAAADVPHEVGHQVAVGRGLVGSEEGRVAVEVHLHAVDVEALEELGND